MKKFSRVILSFFVSFLFFNAAAICYADDTTSENTSKNNIVDQAANSISDLSDQANKTLNESRQIREQARFIGLLNYSPLDLLLPSKYGISLALVPNASQTWELEYLRSSISVPVFLSDLGGMTDQRVSILGRSFFGNNSFNLSYGVSYFDFSIALGDKLLSGVTGGATPSADLVSAQALGLNIGIGNRWSFANNITFGIDWISLSQPILVTGKNSKFLDLTSNQADKDSVDAALKIISYFPRFAFLKLQLGYQF